VGISRNFIEMMIVEKLEQADPTLDVMGYDYRVLQTSYQDFINYLKFHWNLIGKNASRWELAEKLERQFQKDSSELEAFLTVWVTMWLRKWKERVKLLIGDQDQNKEFFKQFKIVEANWKKIEHKQELTEIVTGTLIKNGEICGTEIIAESLLKGELKRKRTRTLNDKKHILKIINNSLRRAREISQSKGPLIFVKIDKNYYSSE
jgi:hypothetical protein